MGSKRHLLALFWLVFGLANLLRAGIAHRLGGTLALYTPAVSLPFLGWLYAGWGAAFLIGAALAWQHRGLRWAIPLALAYQATGWALRLCAYRAEYARALWARDAVLTALFILVVAWLAHAKPPQQRERVSDES